MRATCSLKAVKGFNITGQKERKSQSLPRPLYASTALRKNRRIGNGRPRGGLLHEKPSS